MIKEILEEIKNNIPAKNKPSQASNKEHICLNCKAWSEQYRYMNEELFLTGYSFLNGETHNDLRWCINALGDGQTLMLTRVDSERKCFK